LVALALGPLPPVERAARMPPVGAEVPVIPEADSLGLLALGALGVLAATLLRRRP
jgi:MYXO-CTERM domain-containing protein